MNKDSNNFNCSRTSTDVEQSLGSESFLTEAERHQLLVEWNNTKTEYPQDKCIHQLFEEQVERTPDAIALVFEGEQLTYQELNARANQLAHYLQTLGVGAEVLVGICVERSLEMVVGLLGILKAGGAYVPLDPDYPQERLSFMLADTQLKVLLTQEKLVESLIPNQARVVCLDTHWQSISLENQNSINSTVSSENLSYVIYTSGSTGTPKGVAVTHQAVNRLVKNTNYIQLTPSDRVAQAANIAFDAATFEIWGALLSGAKLVIITKSVLLSPPEFAFNIDYHQISVLFLTTALFNQLANFVPQAFSSLRCLLFGGEAVDPKWVQQVLYKGAPKQLLHIYGPTENTTFSSWYLVEDLPTTATTIPIGRAISNTQIYLLDQNLQPVPIGVPGELHIGGAGLARGYLNRPELTEEKFIPNPYSNEPGERLYKTGDRVRYLSDGNIEFLGRIDNQVKIRGFRIELGEIEAVLSQHPAVQSTVVVLREDVPNKKQLVAYVVHDHKHVDKVAQKLIPDIRSFLQERLPDYMMPSAIALLDALPLNPNGKVDRQALPALDTTRPDLEEDFVAPRTQIEQVLAEVWSKVLGLEQVGIHDKFLELGGHSLLAIQIISRLRDILNVELPLDSFFVASPTIAEQAKRIEAGDWKKPFKQAPSIQPISRGQDLPLSWSQEHLWFLAQLEPDAPIYNEPFTIYFKSAIDVEALSKALNEIIQRHESLRTNFITVNGQPVQAIAPPSTFNLTVVDLRKLPQKERETEAFRLATIDAKKLFDLTDGLLLRATLMQLADEDYRLFLTCHHIVIDGFSLYNVFLKELEILYEAFSTDHPSSLTLLPIQYVDFALWQRQSVTQEVLSSQLNYWKQQLADLPLLHLPYDRPRSARQTFRGARFCFVLSKDLTLELKALSQQSRVTLYTTLLAAFKTLLYRYTGQSDIVVGTVSARRNQPQIEELIGYFLNTLVLRTDMSGCPSFLELLSRVQEVTLAAYAHEDLPFLQLVQTLQLERNPGQNPLFQVAFVLEPPMPSLKSGWTLSQLDIQTDMAKFDLTLELDNRPEGIIGRFEYNTDLFETSTIYRVAGHFQTLLAGIVANPQQPISELPLLTEAERHQLLVEWNNTQTEYPQDKCIHQLFEEQVKRSPTSVAVVLEEEHLTYRQLNAKANQLAHYLQTLGVGADVLVGICVERSLEMVVGILGILKAGGAYVPLDPAYPPERLAFMLEDSRVSHLLTQEQLVASLSPHQARVIHLDTHWKVIAQESEENPNSGVTTENLAYVIYTSGSTGKPKGAMNTHRGICNRLLWMQDVYRLTQSDRVLQKTPFSFDVSVWEFFWPLLTGACIVVAQPEGHKNSGYLVKLIAQQQVSTLHFVPSMLRVFLEEQNLEACRCLKRVICSGEALPFELQERFFARLDAELYNLYGPTEAAVDVTSWTCERNSERRIVFIGRPIANTQIYLLDSQMQPVPIGVLGELHIGGIGLARGYFNRPDLTAEKFIPNPFSDKPGDRLYKTGDLARYLPDGNIEYLGRIDHQVKLRGFRIELGEVESVLGQHPAVQASAVIDREDVPGSKCLVAYVVPNQQEAINSGQPLLAQMEQLLVGQQRYELPNGMAIAHLNKNETDFLYQECFEDLAYLKHKITLNEGDCIFDVGANIGLFSLFVGQMCKNAVIYAFEPLPPIFEVLRINTTLYGLNAKLFEYGLGKKNHSDTFTYYPNISIISGRFANFQDEREVVKSFLLQQQSSTGTKTTLPSEELLDELLADRLKSEKFTCQLRTLSEVIRENGVERIDLLKIDVEKSEMDVLEGIQEEDWQKIAQIVVEVHDINNRLESVTTLLKKHGYNLVIEQDAQLKNTDIHNIYAVCPTNSQKLPSKISNKSLEVSVGANSQNQGLENHLPKTAWYAEQISKWQILYDDLYSQSATTRDASFNIIGWNSSYTGLPIPEVEMCEWVDNTVKQILSLQPSSVLEIGCGTGLLLSRIAPHCTLYWGTDFSQVAIQHLQQLKMVKPELAQVTLLQRMADNFEGIEANSFDTVILNSVVQYFPGIDYLLHVLEGAINAVERGGFIFVGNIRSLPLLEAYHASVELHQASNSLMRSQLTKRIRQRMDREEELVLDPAFFTALKEHFPQIGHVEIQLKRGIHHNELTRFRYDVILHIGTKVSSTENMTWLDWQKHELKLPDVRQLLQSEPEILGLHRVPNARTLTEVKTLEWLFSSDKPDTLGEWRSQKLSKLLGTGVDPEELWAISNDLPYAINISWADSGTDGCYNVVFRHRTKMGTEALDSQMSLALTQQSKHWSEYGNNPIQGKLARNLIPDIRNFLQEKLPDYMVPSAFLLMKALPLTPNGKVDRRALRALDNWDRELKDNFVAPITPTEEILAAIWTEVLGMQQVGVNKNFFELGGHSLLATQIISRIRSAFSIELPLRSLFEAPTIASLAQVIEAVQKEELQEQSEGSAKFDTLLPLVPVARDTHIPLSFSQQMVWELQQLHIDSSAYNCPIALCFNGLLRKEELEKSINEIIRRHQILRTTFAVVNEQPVQVIAPSLTLPLNVIDLQHLPQQEQEVEAVRLANQEALHHFDLAAGPLIKTTLLCLAPQKHWLLITMHHIITDGWSYGIFLQELGMLYEAFLKGVSSPLPEVTIQYADFTLWQQKYLNEEALEKQCSYWLKKLTNISAKLDLLPGFQPKFKSSSKRTGSYSMILSSNQVTLIEALSRSQGVTTFAIILTALKILLYKLSGQTDIIILATTANRSTPEIEKMLGCFINDVFLRDRIDNFQTGITFLEQVNQTIFEALANQEIPEKLLKPVSELEFLRTINVIMAPPKRCHAGILGWEVASVSLEHDLWDEQSCPLEIYLHFQDQDSTAIEIVSFYSTSCFTDKSIECFFQDYRGILKQLTQYPRKLLSEFTLVS